MWREPSIGCVDIPFALRDVYQLFKNRFVGQILTLDELRILTFQLADFALASGALTQEVVAILQVDALYLKGFKEPVYTVFEPGNILWIRWAGTQVAKGTDLGVVDGF